MVDVRRLAPSEPIFIGMGKWSDDAVSENDLYVVPGALVVVPERRVSRVLRRIPLLVFLPPLGWVLWHKATGVRPDSDLWILLVVMLGNVAHGVTMLSLRRKRRETWQHVTDPESEQASASSGARQVPLATMTGFVDATRKWGVVFKQPRIAFMEGEMRLFSSRSPDVARIQKALEDASREKRL